MGLGYKYHIVTISAIFFALTIGLVVGSVFVSPQFVNRQDRAIKQLQETLNSDIEDQRRELQQKSECIQAITPLALRGRMAGATVAIIQTGDYPDVAAHASDAIAMAGPKEIVHLVIAPAVDQRPDELAQSLSRMHDGNEIIPADPDGLFQQIASALAHGDGIDHPVLAELERAGLVQRTPDDPYSFPVRYAVVVAGSRTIESVRASRVDVPLIRALLRSGISVVACEGKDAAATDIPALHVVHDDISTVDNVDTEVGRCALVLAFSRSHGDYGVKPGASHVMPVSNSAP